jgi:hypothetical protein
MRVHVREPQPALMPARPLAERQAVHQCGQFAHVAPPSHRSQVVHTHFTLVVFTTRFEVEQLTRVGSIPPVPFVTRPVYPGDFRQNTVGIDTRDTSPFPHEEIVSPPLIVTELFGLFNSNLGMIVFTFDLKKISG